MVILCHSLVSQFSLTNTYVVDKYILHIQYTTVLDQVQLMKVYGPKHSEIIINC